MKDALKVSADNNIDRNIIFLPDGFNTKVFYILAQAMKEVAQNSLSQILVAGMKKIKGIEKNEDL